MTALTEDDIERLASRLAMMVSEDGEAENAGRAVGQLARRLGMTGGELKEIFMAGATREVAVVQPPRSVAEISALRANLRQAEERARDIERERDALQREVAGLRTRLYQMKAATRGRWLVGVGAVVLAIVAAAGVVTFVPLGTLQNVAPKPVTAIPDDAPGQRRTAMVHAAHAPVFQQPDREAAVVATLPSGMPIVVRRLVWNMLMQWAEVEVGGRVGYVLTTDIDLT